MRSSGYVIPFGLRLAILVVFDVGSWSVWQLTSINTIFLCTSNWHLPQNSNQDMWHPGSTAGKSLDRRDLHLVDWDNDGACDIVWTGMLLLWLNSPNTWNNQIARALQHQETNLLFQIPITITEFQYGWINTRGQGPGPGITSPIRHQCWIVPKNVAWIFTTWLSNSQTFLATD